MTRTMVNGTLGTVLTKSRAPIPMLTNTNSCDTNTAISDTVTVALDNS